jgi:antitoxin ParD1/3/4
LENPGIVDSRPSLAYIANDTKGYSMATRNVVLTDAQSSLVDRLVETGRYQNASEALRAGLRLLEREENEIKALRNQLSAGLAQARAGDLAEGSGEDAIRRVFASARGKA